MPFKSHLSNIIINAMIKLLIILILLFFVAIKTETLTMVKEKHEAYPGKITVKEIKRPHNLFIGRCIKNYPQIHQETVILNNDGKSQITANIKINVQRKVYITCINIYDEDPELQAYPSYIAGGIGQNFVEFNVITSFGKGFKFNVEIFGYALDNK